MWAELPRPPLLGYAYSRTPVYVIILIQARLSTNCLERESAATSSVHSSLYEQIFTVTLDLSVQASKNASLSLSNVA